MKELNVERELAQKPRFQVRLTLLPTRRTTSSTTWIVHFATKKAATAVLEPIMARLNSFRPDSTKSPGSVMEERCLRQRHEDEER